MNVESGALEDYRMLFAFVGPEGPFLLKLENGKQKKINIS